MYEKNGAEYSTRTECIDWRYSAAILGLVKFYEYAQIKGFDLKFDYDEDYIIDMNNSMFKESFKKTSCGWRGKNILKRNALIRKYIFKTITT